MARANISVDKQLATSLADEALRENKTMYALANEVLGTFLKLAKDGCEIGQLPKLWELLKVMKDQDAVPVPGDMLEEMLRKLYEADKRWLLTLARKYGEKLGLYLSTFYPSLVDLLTNNRDILTEIFPIKRIELESTRDQEGLTIFTFKTVGVGRSKEVAEVVNELIKGLLSAYSEVKICNCHVGDGLMEVGFELGHEE